MAQLALTILGWTLCALVGLPLLVLIYEMIVGLWPSAARTSAKTPPRIAILMPAHNEEAGIGPTLAALQKVMPQDVRVLVVADNCSDATAQNAREAGAEVIERSNAQERGKGYALSFGRDHLAKTGASDVVIVLDADCRFEQGSIEALASAAADRQVPVQAINLIEGDLAAGAMVQVSSFAMVVKNLFRSRGMHRIGGAALLTGTGMAFPWARIKDAKLATGSIVEDLALGIEMTREGHAPALISDAHVRSAPADMRDALDQRKRWEHGFLSTLRSCAVPTFLGGLKRLSLAEMLLGLHLLVPPLALLLMLSFAVWAVLAGLAWFGGVVIPALALSAGLALALVLILIGWVVGGRPYLSGAALLRIPFYMLWKLPVYLSFLKGPQALWNRTPRRP
jgi:cellulose synthase/poly-beta-1,6-N-acetylglucosamine synthase-like glycosyltransferase